MALLPSGTSSTAQTSTQPYPFSPPHVSDINFCLNALSLSHTHTHTNISLSHAPWIIDIGAPDHMVCCTSFFTTVTSVISQPVELPNGTHVFATHIGTIQLTPFICLTQVLCIPTFNFNLLSVKNYPPILPVALCFSLILVSFRTFYLGQRLRRVK
jgi:hypothetical protein